MSDRQNEIDRNLEFFIRQLPSLLPAYQGKFALIRHQKIEGFYDTVVDAVNAGNKLYPDRIFSVQPVTDTAVDLGFYSHARSLGIAQPVADISGSRNT
jgi:hypothetical protein